MARVIGECSSLIASSLFVPRAFQRQKKEKIGGVASSFSDSVGTALEEKGKFMGKENKMKEVNPRAQGP